MERDATSGKSLLHCSAGSDEQPRKQSGSAPDSCLDAGLDWHQPSGGMQGQASDIAIQAEQIMYLKRMMAERIAFHTGQPVERIEADSDRDRWFTADEAREYGFIDEVIQKDAMEVPTAGAGAAS